MFKSTGEKIMSYSKVFFWIYLVAYVIIGIACFVVENWIVGFSIIVGGVLADILFSKLICGFGELLENSETLVNQNKEMLKYFKENKI